MGVLEVYSARGSFKLLKGVLEQSGWGSLKDKDLTLQSRMVILVLLSVRGRIFLRSTERNA